MGHCQKVQNLFFQIFTQKYIIMIKFTYNVFRLIYCRFWNLIIIFDILKYVCHLLTHEMVSFINRFLYLVFKNCKICKLKAICPRRLKLSENKQLDIQDVIFFLQKM